MAGGTTYQGGLADADGAVSNIKSGPYRAFVAFEHAAAQNVLLIKVMGQVAVGNPGIKAVLSYAEPQGIDPEVLLLNLTLRQRPGVWPQVGTWVPARYTAVLIKSGDYGEVQIVNPDLGDLTIKVIPI
jgi:hypothetical protein